MDFIALDVETANPNMASICAIGLCRFIDGFPVSETHFLIDPRDDFDHLNVSIHGITAEMVAGRPSIADVLPVMQRALSGQIVVHHTHFDRIALSRAAERAGHPPLDCRWLDSARVARRTWDDVAFAGYGLRSLADRIGFDFRHHDACQDAKAAGLVLAAAIRTSGRELEAWFERVDKPLGVRRASDQISIPTGVFAGSIAEENVVFTGTLKVPRRQMSDRAAAAGWQVQDGVTRNTTVLVVGDQDIRRVGAGGKSAKHRKAEAIIANGGTLRIVTESDFLTLTA